MPGYARGCQDALQEVAVSLTTRVPGITLRPSGLAASTFTCIFITPARVNFLFFLTFQNPNK